MAICDVDGCCRKANRSLCEFLGYSEEELLGSPFQEITHPEDLGQIILLFEQLLRGECASHQTEKRYIHKSGRVLWALLSVSLARDEAGNPECFVSQIQDISARKEAEQDRDCLMSLPLVFQCVAGFDGTIKRVSRSCLDMFGYSEEEIFGAPFIEFYHPDDRASALAESLTMMSGKGSRFYQGRILCKDGTSRWLLWCGVGVPERQLLYAIATDISPLKEAEQKAAEMLQEKEELISQLQRSFSEIRRLQEHLITVCAWTKRIRYNGEWLSAEEFLRRHLGLKLTHGISDEGVRSFLREAE